MNYNVAPAASESRREDDSHVGENCKWTQLVHVGKEQPLIVGVSYQTKVPSNSWAWKAEMLNNV